MTPSLSWLRSTKRGRACRCAPSLLELPEVVDHDDRVPVDVQPVLAGDLLHPLAAVRRPDPQGAVDAEGVQAEGAPVEEHVLAGVRAEALAEEHHPRPGSGALPHALEHAQPEQPVLLARGLDHPERQRRGPPGVLQRHGGDVAQRQVLQRQRRPRSSRSPCRSVTRGRSSDRSKAPVRSISASARSTRSRGAPGAVQSDVHLHGGGTGRLAHHRLDGQIRVRRPDAPGAAAAGRMARACRRPSRPRVAQGTRLPGPPLTVDGTQRVASSTSITGTSAVVPGLQPLHRPVPERGDADPECRQEGAVARPLSRRREGPAAAGRPAARPASASRCSP